MKGLLQQILFPVLVSITTALSGDQNANVAPFDTPESSAWATQQLANMSLDQKLGQLFMVAAYSNKSEAHVAKVTDLVKNYHIGGLIFMQGGPVRQATLTNKYQALAKTPLMIAMDAEWGLNMRLDSTVRYPWAMSLGAIQDPKLVYEMGADLAKQCQRLGVHINFAPVVDVNTNPKNPIINRRSFGEDKIRVSKLGEAYMNGMQDNHVLACAKHFPGHGDTESDSHKSLPIVNHSLARIKEMELYPFQQLIDHGLGSMMIAHLYIPALDTTTNLASTLSSKVVDELLKQQMKFKGLVFTDALNMKGVSKYYEPGVVDLMAFKAGNDVLLFAEDVPKAISVFKEALSNGDIHINQIDARVRKILKAKHWMGLAKRQKIETKNLYEDLNPLKSKLLVKRLTEATITVTKNSKNILPFKSLEKKSIGLIQIGGEKGAVFKNRLKHYSAVKEIATNHPWGIEAQKDILTQLEGVSTLIIGIHKSDKNPWKSYKLSKSEKEMLTWLVAQRRTVIDLFTNPYALIGVNAANNADAIMLSYQNSNEAQDVSAQMLFGAKPIRGVAPVSALPVIKEGQGIKLGDLGRLEYGRPEENGIRSADLDSIGLIMNAAIEGKATPGGQILVAHKGKVIYNESFGYHTYNNLQKVTWTDLYDLASVTKIGATVPVLMQLQGMNFFNLNNTLGAYLKDIPDEKKQMKIKDILSHTAGLKSWIPFYLKATEDGVLRDDLFSNQPRPGYSIPVARNVFMKDAYRDSVYYRIDTTSLREDKDYKYSDLGYYYLQRVVEAKTGKSLDKVVEERFAGPLGADLYGYNPLKRFHTSQVVPSEQDVYFRGQLIQGNVHDPGAAMLGGVGGHAGLFSNANDLAKMMQMYLQKGYYGGRQFLNPDIVDAYTQYQDQDTNHRRGAGFDKPMRCCGGGGSCCDCVSSTSYGHSGFTGTLVWVDPEMELVYVFLSNRVYPDAANFKLVKDNVRTEIQRIIYKALPVSLDYLNS